jgi:hypothetical protein
LKLERAKKISEELEKTLLEEAKMSNPPVKKVTKKSKRAATASH